LRGSGRGVRILEDRPPALPVGPQGPPPEAGHVRVGEEDLPRRRLLEAQHKLGGGGLAATALSHHAQGAAGLDGERDVVHRPHHASGLAEKTTTHGEVFGETAGLQEWRHPRAAPTVAGAATQQRARCCGPSWLSGGASARQRSITYGQRGWKAQPGGKAAGSGGWALVGVGGPVAAANFGMGSVRARVFGCGGSLKMLRTGPASTRRPAYITATWSHIRATMPRLWVMKIMARPRSRWMSPRSLRYCAWIVTSRLVVGSSAMRSCGPQEIAMAPTTRWRIPP